MKGCENIHALARELGVERKLLYSWKYQFQGRPEKNHANYGTAAPETSEARLRKEIRDLRESLGAKTAELDFFAAALRRVEREQKKLEAGGPGSTPRSMPRLSRKGT